MRRRLATRSRVTILHQAKHNITRRLSSNSNSHYSNMRRHHNTSLLHLQSHHLYQTATSATMPQQSVR